MPNNSSLTAALLGSQNADPTALMLNPQLQLAQKMISEGTETSPIRSPWEGVARLAQVLAGSHMQNKAYMGASSMYSQAADAAAESLKKAGMDGTPLYNALTSKNLNERVTGLQAYAKAGLLQASEPRDLHPGEQTTAPGIPAPVASNTNALTEEGRKAQDIASNPGVITSNTALAQSIARANADAKNESDLKLGPQIAGQTAAAENRPLAQRAGMVAASEAPWKTFGTRSGAEIPLTAMPGIGLNADGSRAPGPTGAPPPSMPTPKVQPDIPGPAPGVAPPPPPAGAAAPGASPPVAAPGGPPVVPAAAPGGSGPQQFGGGVRTLPGGAGIMAPSQETFAPLIKDDNAEVLADREHAIAGQSDLATIASIRDLLPKVKPGWSSETKLEAGRVLQAIGVDPTNVSNLTSNDVAAAQVLQKKFLEMSASAERQMMGARGAASALTTFRNAYPSIGTDAEATNLQTNMLSMAQRRAQSMATQKTNYFNDSVNNLQQTGEYRGLKGFNEQFAKTDDPEDYMHAAEAMSGAKWSPWDKITDRAAQRRIISLIPPGQQYFNPEPVTMPDGTKQQTFMKR